MKAKRPSAAACTLATVLLAALCCIPLAGCSIVRDGDSVTVDFGGALEGAEQAIDDARESVDAAIEGAGAALEEAMATISTDLQGSLDTVKSALSRTTEIEVSDAQSGEVVATVADEAAITDLLGALDYASWRTVSTNPPAADAQYTLRCLQSSVGILDSGTLHEVLSFTTYEGGFIELGVLNVGSIVFEVPQADVDALNALAEEG